VYDCEAQEAMDKAKRLDVRIHERKGYEDNARYMCHGTLHADIFWKFQSCENLTFKLRKIGS
jgi:hypothetical protein